MFVTEAELEKGLELKFNLRGGTDSYRLDYKGRGHDGYTPIQEDSWMTNVHCFSGVCKDDTDIVIRPKENSRIVITKSQWEKLIKIMRGLNPVLKDQFKDEYTNYEEYICRFNSGNGYANYLAFMLWRFSIQQPKCISLLLHIYSKGFNPLQSFMIMAALRRSWYHTMYGGVMFQSSYCSPDIEERLAKCHTYYHQGPYTMGDIVFEYVPNYLVYDAKKEAVSVLYEETVLKYNKRLYNKIYKMFSDVIN